LVQAVLEAETECIAGLEASIRTLQQDLESSKRHALEVEQKLKHSEELRADLTARLHHVEASAAFVTRVVMEHSVCLM
jgi:hypothetical protein